MDVDRVTGSGCVGCQPRRYAGEGPQVTLSATSPGGRLGVRHISGGRQPPEARVDESRTEERGPVIQRINRDLKVSQEVRCWCKGVTEAIFDSHLCVDWL